MARIDLRADTQVPSSDGASVTHRFWRARPGVPAWLWSVALVALLLAAASFEVRTSALQAWVLSRWASSLSYRVEPGPSPRIAFPSMGPFDERRGYARLPEIQQRLEAEGWRVVEQAHQWPGTARLVGWGITPPYREPAAVGLVIRDRHRVPVYEAGRGGALFEAFEDVPPLLVRTLLFIENRELGRAIAPWSNPALDWQRLARASWLYAGSSLGLPVRVEGGSTLATQMEKYRHSASGRTSSPLDKLRQITGASLRAYRDGPDTRQERRRVIVDYLNTIPLAAVPGHGEVHGLGEGLRAWFGLDLAEVSRALAGEAGPDRTRAYKHVLALLYALRAPTYYLVDDRPALERRLDGYARVLASEGVIEPALARGLGAVRLAFRLSAPTPPEPFPAERKAGNAVREELRRLLGIPGFYELDRLHLEVETTLDHTLQTATARLFRRLEERRFVNARGLHRENLLSAGDPGHVVHSLLLYEGASAGNLLRVRADSLDAPFDVNDGMKLELGSTAKLRVLTHYLEVMLELHGELGELDRPALAERARAARDPLTRWAAAALARQPGLDPATLLDRALGRTYPASPHEVFFTGGGAHVFQNFDGDQDDLVPSIRQAFARSINLVFVRLLRDLVRYHEARLQYDAAAVLADPGHADRARMLREVADEEARQFLLRAWRRFREREPAGVVSALLGPHARSPRALAVLFYAWHPAGDAEALRRWLGEHGADVPPEEVARLVRAYGDRRLTIADYGYLLSRHPLDVWGAGEMARAPGLGWEELLARSGEARAVASAWLFQTRHRRAQDLRLRTRIEQDAFARMTPFWHRLGFPFERLVPSYATALGTSSDRPTALAELIGIIANDGRRHPAVQVRRLVFAPGTPYHTVLEPPRMDGEQVLAAPVAAALRAVLTDTVERGTARRLRGAFVDASGAPVVIGGKTGSGDNRFETVARDGSRVSSRAVSRTGAFVFSIGDRYFGVVTASVSGPTAKDYGFTSALPLAVLGLLAPEINAGLAGDSPPGVDAGEKGAMIGP